MDCRRNSPQQITEVKVSEVTLVRFPVDPDALLDVYHGCAFPLAVLIQQATRGAPRQKKPAAKLWHGVGAYYPVEPQRHKHGYILRHSYWWLPISNISHPIVERSTAQVDKELEDLEALLVRDPTCYIVQLIDEYVARAMVDYFAEMAICGSRSMIRGYFAERLLHIISGVRGYFLMIKMIVEAGEEDNTDKLMYHDCVEALKWMKDLGIEESHYLILEQWLEVDIRNYLHFLSLLKD